MTENNVADAVYQVFWLAFNAKIPPGSANWPIDQEKRKGPLKKWLRALLAMQIGDFALLIALLINKASGMQVTAFSTEI